MIPDAYVREYEDPASQVLYADSTDVEILRYTGSSPQSLEPSASLS